MLTTYPAPMLQMLLIFLFIAQFLGKRMGWRGDHNVGTVIKELPQEEIATGLRLRLTRIWSGQGMTGTIGRYFN